MATVDNFAILTRDSDASEWKLLKNVETMDEVNFFVDQMNSASTYQKYAFEHLQKSA